MINKKQIKINTDALNYQPDGIIWLNNFEIIFINNKALELFEMNSGTIKTKLNLSSIIAVNSINKIKSTCKTFLKNENKKKKIILQGFNKQKNRIDFDASISLFEIDNQKIIQLQLTPINKINKKPSLINNQKTNTDLDRQKKQFDTLLETSDHLIWLLNSSFELTAFNKNFSDLVFSKYKIKLVKGIKISKFITKEQKEYVDFWHPKYNEAFEGKKLVFIKEEFHKKYICRQIFINPIYSENNQIDEICCIAHDITDSVLYEKKINSQNGRLNAIFDSSQHYIWTIDKNDRLTSFNKNYFDLVTDLYQTQPYLGATLNRGVMKNNTQYVDLLNQQYNKAFNGIATSFEIDAHNQLNDRVYLEIFLNPIYNNNQVVEVSGIAHDITDKKMVQQKMEISLKEKEVLLKEVHHRVKNNMQVISSILNLQSFYVKDIYTLGLLKESQNRISTMAYIHESLYQNNSFSAVNFSEYIKRLIRNIISSYSYNSENIKLKQQIDEIALSLDIAIPLGLIINELITNSLKHAFGDRKKGTIIINLTTENNYVFLNLMDDGIGLEEGFVIENSQSLGLQLVSTLIEQIGASYKLISKKNKGTKFNISFQI